MHKHIFFDMDDTLTLSKSAMDVAHVPLFLELCASHDVIVVSGQDEQNIRRQIPSEADGRYYLLTQNGNHAIDKNGTVMWYEEFSAQQKEAIMAFIKTVHDELALQVKDENDLVEDRGSQISYSLIGHHEEVAKKKAFDPKAEKRIQILREHAAEVDALKQLGVEISAGGTTCFDIILLGRNKGFNVARLIEHEGWKKDESLYVGDALEPGRNDESVIGVIATHAVKDHFDTFRFIKENLVS
ncbi:MAG: HAD-IIB family hydrolase [Candidatus Pacebacteria bacterium]|nr:HAD-IIB family hydrolase [Candidatus Paceibacterota bacterium]